MMEVILLERIENLGQMGDVVRVRPGFARNYLLPKRKALRATKDNMARFESQRAQLEAQNLKRRQEAEAVGSKLDGLKVVLLRQASEAGANPHHIAHLSQILDPLEQNHFHHVTPPGREAAKRRLIPNPCSINPSATITITGQVRIAVTA